MSHIFYFEPRGLTILRQIADLEKLTWDELDAIMFGKQPKEGA